MKHLIKFLTFSILFLSINYSFAQTTILGGAGVSTTDGDPDLNTSLATQGAQYESHVAWDRTNSKLYVYKAGNSLGNRWDEVPLTATIDTDTRLDNPQIVGSNLQFDVINALTNAVVGTESIPILSIAPVQDVNAGTGISVADAAGVYTVTNTAPDQTVSITGAGISVVTGTYPNFTVTSTEVDAVIGNEYNTGISLTAGTLNVTDGGGTLSQNLISADAGNQIVAGTDGRLLVNKTQVLIISDNHATAGVAGVAIGEEFEASATNDMGVPPGTRIFRRF